MPPDEPTADGSAAGAAPASGADLTDDQILAQMTAERQAKADEELLGKDEPGKGKKGGQPAKPPADDDGDEEDDEEGDDEPETDDLDDDSDEDDEPTQPSRSRAKARKLFDKGDVKGALKAALGLSDEDLEAKGDWDDPKFVNAKFRAYRAKVTRTEAEARERDRKHSEREQKFGAYVQSLGPKLQPAVQHLKLKAEYQKTGDPNIIVQVIEDFAGEGYDIVQKKVLRGEKRSPGEARLLSKVAELEERLAKIGQPKEPSPEEQKQAAQEQLKTYLSEIKEEIAEHDVRKIPGAAKKVYATLRKHYDPKLKAPKISIEKAADIVLRRHMRIVRRLAPASATSEAPAVEANGKTKKVPAKVVAHSRAQTREAAVLDDDPSDDDILRQMELERAQKRRDEARRAGGAR